MSENKNNGMTRLVAFVVLFIVFFYGIRWYTDYSYTKKLVNKAEFLESNNVKRSELCNAYENIMNNASSNSKQELYQTYSEKYDQKKCDPTKYLTLMMSLDSFKDYHNDAGIVLKKLTRLKESMDTAIELKNIHLLASVSKNTYRIINNVKTNRMTTIPIFEVCDEALDTLGMYASDAETYYSGRDTMTIGEIDNLRNTFNDEFEQCQSIVTDKTTEALYKDYQ